jgi:hypothetical protein
MAHAGLVVCAGVVRVLVVLVLSGTGAAAI